MGLFDFFTDRVPDQKAFTALVVEHMKKSGEQRPISVDPQRFQVTVGDPGGGMNVLWLGNAYNEYCALPKAQRSGVLKRYEPAAYANLDFFERKDDALRSLLPRVRDRGYPHLLSARMRRQLGSKEADHVGLPYRPLGDVLASSLCIDLPTTVLDCTTQTYEGWKSSIDELWPTALENLRAISKTPFRQVSPGVYVSPWSDSHDPARLLLPELFKGLNVKGRVIAGVPNRSTLIVTGSEDPRGLDEFVALMKMGLKDPRPLSSMPLMLTDDGWRAFEPRGDAPQFQHLRRLAVECRHVQHADQKTELVEQFTAEEHDVFVATWCAAVNSTTQEIINYASWTEGVPTLLPKVELLSFVVPHGDDPGNAEVIQVKWDDALPLVKDLMQPQPQYWPERWLVDDFPAPDVFAKLKAMAR
ncbi:MAG: hypothetical protein U0228_13025 [Myxococcaceae bacterium]